MKDLINYLLQFAHLNQQQIDLISSKGVFREIKKDEWFQEAGRIPREVGFLTEGIVRICYYNNKSEEITKYFIDETHFIVDITSYYQNIPSSSYIQAITTRLKYDGIYCMSPNNKKSGPSKDTFCRSSNKEQK